MTALTVEMPVDRNATKAGQPMEIKVEDRTVPATVDAILPLASRFEALRDLVPSAASAILVVPNTDGRLRAGQTVYSPFVPRDVVADVPNSCITNSPDGNQKSRSCEIMSFATSRSRRWPRSDRTARLSAAAFDPSDEVIESAIAGAGGRNDCPAVAADAATARGRQAGGHLAEPAPKQRDAGRRDAQPALRHLVGRLDGPFSARVGRRRTRSSASAPEKPAWTEQGTKVSCCRDDPAVPAVAVEASHSPSASAILEVSGPDSVRKPPSR